MSSINGNQTAKTPTSFTIGQHTDVKLTGEMNSRQIDREQDITVAKIVVGGVLCIGFLGVLCFLGRD